MNIDEKKEFFYKKVTEEIENYDNICIIKKYIDEVDVFSKLFDLCRLTFETQFNSEIFKDGNGALRNFISNETFAILAKQIEEFIDSLEEDKSILFNEVLFILKKYYKTTASYKESNRSYFDDSNDSVLSKVGTMYFLNEIDWSTFTVGIVENMKIEIKRG